MMKRFLVYILLPVLGGIFFSCNGNKTTMKHDYAGTFVSEDSVTFVLREDSTTSITFPGQAASYESSWSIVTDVDGVQWANIEFGGNQRYYYLKDGLLYRSERNMRHDFMGVKVKYIDPMPDSNR